MGITSDIAEGIFSYLLSLVNDSFQPLLGLVKKLLSEKVNVGLFSHPWSIVIYILAIFYGIFLLFAGFNFIISGHDVVKRENAKVWLRNILIMAVLIQFSSILYELIINVSSGLTSGVLQMINPSFFIFSADNLASFGLTVLFSSFYAIILILTAIILSVRYLFVSVGLIFAPIGIFLYFLPPFKEYGKLILNFLGICIFIPFFDALILLASSMMLEIPIFNDLKILVMISSFLLISLSMLYLLLFAIIKSSLDIAGSISGKIGLIKSLIGA